MEKEGSDMKCKEIIKKYICGEVRKWVRKGRGKYNIKMYKRGRSVLEKEKEKRTKRRC